MPSSFFPEQVSIELQLRVAKRTSLSRLLAGMGILSNFNIPALAFILHVQLGYHVYLTHTAGEVILTIMLANAATLNTAMLTTISHTGAHSCRFSVLNLAPRVKSFSKFYYNEYNNISKS